MEQKIIIALRFKLAIGDVSLNEIVFRLKELRVVECCRCGAFYSLLLSALRVGRYARRESNFEQEVIENFSGIMADGTFRFP